MPQMVGAMSDGHLTYYCNFGLFSYNTSSWPWPPTTAVLSKGLCLRPVWQTALCGISRWNYNKTSIIHKIIAWCKQNSFVYCDLIPISCFRTPKKWLITEISRNIEVLDSRLRIILYQRFVFRLECEVIARTSATKTFLTTA